MAFDQANIKPFASGKFTWNSMIEAVEEIARLVFFD